MTSRVCSGYRSDDLRTKVKQNKYAYQKHKIFQLNQWPYIKYKLNSLIRFDNILNIWYNSFMYINMYNGN